MALSCTTAFSSNTVGVTQQQVACLGPKVVNLDENELLPEQFLLLVIDSLNRLGAAEAFPRQIADVSSCDVSEALRLARCADHDLTPVFSVTTPQLQGIILAMLNEGLCSI